MAREQLEIEGVAVRETHVHQAFQGARGQSARALSAVLAECSQEPAAVNLDVLREKVRPGVASSVTTGLLERYRKFREDPLRNKQQIRNSPWPQELQSRAYRCKAAMAHAMVVITVVGFVASSAYTLVYPPLSFVIALSQHLRGKVDLLSGARAFASILFCSLTAIGAWIFAVGLPSATTYARTLRRLQPLRHRPNQFDTPTWHAHLWQQIELEYAKRSGRAVADVREEMRERQQGSGGGSGSLAEAYCLQCLSAWSR